MVTAPLTALTAPIHANIAPTATLRASGGEKCIAATASARPPTARIVAHDHAAIRAARARILRPTENHRRDQRTGGSPQHTGESGQSDEGTDHVHTSSLQRGQLTRIGVSPTIDRRHPAQGCKRLLVRPATA